MQAFVALGVEHRERHDLAVELAGFGRGGRLAMTVERERVELLARELVVAGP
jgi:hypothetical protein